MGCLGEALQRERGEGREARLVVEIDAARRALPGGTSQCAGVTGGAGRSKEGTDMIGICDASGQGAVRRARSWVVAATEGCQRRQHETRLPHV